MGRKTPFGESLFEWARKIMLALAGSLTLLATGCMVGTAGVVLGILAGVESGDSSVAEGPPLVSDVRVERIDGDVVEVEYGLFDADGGPLTVKIEWRPSDAAQFEAASGFLDDGRALDGEGRIDITVEPGVRRSFLLRWEARQDLRRLYSRGPEEFAAALVVLRISVAEEEVEGDSTETAPFVAGNEPPRILEIQPIDTKGVIPLRVRIADSTGDPVTLRCATFGIGAGENPPEAWQPMTLVGVSAETALLTAPGGEIHILNWDSESERDIGRRASDRVFVEICPQDAFDPGFGESSRIGPIAVDNNDKPVVQMKEVSISPDRSFEIPIRFSVQDQENHPVSVILQWALEGEDFPPLPPEAILEDPDLLEELLTGQDDESARRREAFHMLSEARVTLNGVIAHYPELGPREICAPEFVRAGLVFVPPTQERSRGFPDDPAKIPFREDSGVFLIGREMRLCPGPCWPSSGTAADADDLWTEIEAFDPDDSVATLRDPLPETFSGAPIHYALQATGGLFKLGSNSEEGGLVHTFVWDSSADMTAAGNALDSTVWIRAIGVDSQRGPQSTSGLFILENNSLVRARVLPAELGSSAVAIGDVGQVRGGGADGREDIVLVNEFSNTATVSYQGAGGQFNSSDTLILSTDNRPVAVAIGDVNGDALNDVVVVNKSAATVSVYLQDGRTGLPTDPSTNLLTGPENDPQAVAIGNVNGEDGEDIVVANFGDDTIAVYLQPTGGGVPPQQPSWPPLPVGFNGPRSIAVANVDGDVLNRKDVVVAGYKKGGGEGGVTMFIQKESSAGSPTLATDSKIELERGGQPQAVGVGDIIGGDGGAIEIVVADRMSNTARVFDQNETGEFFLARVLRAEASPSSVAIGDVDGDERHDVVAVNEDSDSMSVFLQASGALGLVEEGGTSRPNTTFETGSAPVSVAIGDLSGDGRGDVLVANRGAEEAMLLLYLQESRGSVSPAPMAQRLAAGDLPTSLAIGDVNGDGRNDIVSGNVRSDDVSVFLQSAQGTLPAVATYTLAAGEAPSSVAIGDVNGDGRNDIAAANATSDDVTVFLQGPEGTLSADERLRLAAGERPLALAVGDLNGDGRNDIAVANGRPDGDGRYTVSVYFQKERTLPEKPSVDLVIPGLPCPVPPPPAGPDEIVGPKSVAIGDINADGLNDLVVGNECLGTICVFCQEVGTLPDRPTQTLKATDSPDSGYPQSVVIEDINDDGLNDVLVPQIVPMGVGIFFQARGAAEEPRGPGGPLYNSNRLLTFSAQPLALAIVDCNGDGRKDVLVVPNNEGCAAFLQDAEGNLGLRTGEHEFTFNQRLEVDGDIQALAVGDINGDGRDDVVAALTSIHALSLYLAR